jgi:hypothetical protein
MHLLLCLRLLLLLPPRLHDHKQCTTTCNSSGPNMFHL